ncbi:hypothetical protein FACS1894140_2140 [Spirochaetia bacterium]|nr:hypothetical protein FACS1894140_2140 [Spirochaetia bacterium]
MKRYSRGKGLFIASFLFIAILGWGSAQESILGSYERNFTRAGLSTKADILRDAATDSRAPEFIGDLYEFALVFALQNAALLPNDADMITIVGIAAQGAGTSDHKASLDTLWKLFSAYRDPQTRTQILSSLAVLGKENDQVIANLNQFLANQNSMYRFSMDLDFVTLLACISALGNLGDKASFPVLFSAIIAGYPKDITAEVEKALDRIDGDYFQFLVGVIRKNPPQEKLAALRLGLQSAKLSPAERGGLAETVLDEGLELKPELPELDVVASTLRSEAIIALGKLKWTRATPLVVKYFYQVQAEYQNKNVPRERLLETIVCLGAMESTEAAQTLALQLGYFNSQMERTGDFDEALTLEVVNALGKIGAKAAYDYLLYVSYLSYPEGIQAAAKAALDQLRW